MRNKRLQIPNSPMPRNNCFLGIGLFGICNELFLAGRSGTQNQQVACHYGIELSKITTRIYAGKRIAKNTHSACLITYSSFSKTRDPIDNLTSQNATYEYEVETRIGG